ncbi:MAG: integrin alpha, partial [Thermodesulfobacteriota bacterium]
SIAFARVRADFNGDGFDDLAIGVPGEDVGSINSAGAVNVIYGTSGGLSATNDQIFTQDTSGIEDFAEVDDFFGLALTSGDFNGDGIDDLAIGVPFEDVGSIDRAGAVNVIYGTSRGLSATNQ